MDTISSGEIHFPYGIRKKCKEIAFLKKKIVDFFEYCNIRYMHANG